jgi:FAD/FMN-containing dehydrogenase
MDEAVELMRPLAEGRYINEIDPVRYPQHVQECFSPADWERLEQLRRQYDPQGVFHTYLGPDGPNPES